MNIYGLIRIPLGGLYVKAGVAKVDVSVANTSRSGVSYSAPEDLEGWTIGFGWDQQLTNGFGIRAEITGHEFDDVEVNNGVAATGNVNYIKISDMIGATGTIAIGTIATGQQLVIMGRSAADSFLFSQSKSWLDGPERSGRHYLPI